jgi:hypothetical protein
MSLSVLGASPATEVQDVLRDYRLMTGITMKLAMDAGHNFRRVATVEQIAKNCVLQCKYITRTIPEPAAAGLCLHHQQSRHPNRQDHELTKVLTPLPPDLHAHFFWRQL